MIDPVAPLHDLAAVALPDDTHAAAIGIRGSAVVSRSEWLTRVDAWQSAFAARPGRRWALLIDDPIEFAAALFGAWHAQKEVHLPADAQPHTLARLSESTDGLAGELPDGLQADTPAAAQPRSPLDPEATKLVLFTSGSSGEPAAIPKRLAQLRAEIEAQHRLHGRHWAAPPGATVWSTVSPQHIYGLLFVVLWPLAAGCAIAAPRLTFPEDMAARIGPDPALLVSSPAHLKRLPETLTWARARAALRAVLSSGGPLAPEAAAEALRVLGVSPIEIYGSSETGGIAWRQRAVHGDRWNPIVGVNWRIDDELLAVQSPFLPDLAWFTSADRVRASTDGGFELLGRADRIVKVEERRVSLTAIEQALGVSSFVAESRALVLGPASGRIAAVVVPTAAGAELLAAQGRKALVGALRTALADRIDRIAWPRHWRMVDALPVNAQGKTTEAALRALFAQPPPWHWLSRDDRSARAERFVDAGLAAFDGHFPQGAILPGVVQLDWVLDAARDAFAITSAVVRLETLKFRQPILPNTALTLALDWDAAACRLGFHLDSARAVHCSGRICFADAA